MNVTSAVRQDEPPRAVGRPGGVLVVDDNRDAADSLALLCRLWGHQVFTAYDGPTALDLYRQHRPGVVLLDIGMPKMDGCEVSRKLRREFPGGGAVVVAVSGFGREEDRQRCSEAGVDRHMIKPVNPPEVQELLAEAFGPGGEWRALRERLTAEEATE